MTESSEEYDIAIVEGSVTRLEDEERLKTIRDRAKVLIALGACATIGGVNKLKNNFEIQDVKSYVYGEAADMPHLETAPVKGLDEVIQVDYKVEGCPIDASELTYVVRCLLAGKKPEVPDYPVCVECKMKENCCRYEMDEICLGPITRAGCGARCPSNGFWCFGCRGWTSDANAEAMEKVAGQYGKTIEDVKSKMALFGSGGSF